MILIWSVDAPTQSYMRQWADAIEPKRLVEIARAPGWPQSDKRKYPVIDFSGWNGGRGGSSWRLLNERLKTVQRALEPAKPQTARVASGVLLAGVFAVVGVGVYRTAQTPVAPAPTEAAQDNAIVAAVQPAAPIPGGIGGPVRLEEPASFDELTFLIEPAARARPLDAPAREDLIEPEIAQPMRFRDSSLMGALSSLADPLLRGDEDDETRRAEGN